MLKVNNQMSKSPKKEPRKNIGSIQDLETRNQVKDCDHIEVEEGESRYGRGDNDYSSYWFCLDCGVELESN